MFLLSYRVLMNSHCSLYNFRNSAVSSISQYFSFDKFKIDESYERRRQVRIT